MSSSGNHRCGNEGDKYGTGAHLHIFTHSHMASDAPQPHITVLQNHHAILSRKNIKAQTPFLQQRDICHMYQKGKVNTLRFSFVMCLGFRWLGSEVQKNERHLREACNTEDTAQSSLVPWLTSDIPQWRVRGQTVGWLTVTPVEHLLAPECEFTFS